MHCFACGAINPPYLGGTIISLTVEDDAILTDLQETIEANKLECWSPNVDDSRAWFPDYHSSCAC